jgi:branched-chain amino acid transport system ATP-binding protein
MSNEHKPSPGLECRHLTARYGVLTACRDVELQVAPGEILALMGPNGAGKTSLVGAMNGTVTGSGEVRVAGVELGAMPAHVRARNGLASVPDNRGLFPTMSIGDNIALGGRLAPRAERADAIERAVARFPFMRQRWSTPAGALSGGEQQMVAIAKCLAGNPRAILLDEPSQGLAPIIVSQLGDTLNSLKATSIAVLLVEQNHGLVMRTADRYVLMLSGRIRKHGGREDLRDRDALAAAYFAEEQTV